MRRFRQRRSRGLELVAQLRVLLLQHVDVFIPLIALQAQHGAALGEEGDLLFDLALVAEERFDFFKNRHVISGFALR